MSKKRFNYIFIAIVIGAVAIANGFIFAYSTYHSPTANPPQNNADVPLNEGGNPQPKSGQLTINGGLVSTAPFSVPNSVAIIGYNWRRSGGVFITNDSSPYGIASVQGVNSGFAPSSLAINPVGGNVGIGTTRPRSSLEVNGDIKADSGIILGGVRRTSWPSGGATGSSIWKLDRMGNAVLSNSNSSIGAWIIKTNPFNYIDFLGPGGVDNSNGIFNFYGSAFANSWNSLSDIRLKKNISNITDALNKVEQLRGVYFNWKNPKDKQKQVGVIAQEVKKVLPEVVSTNKDGIESVDYGKLTALLINAVKEQQNESQEQRKEIQKLQDDIQQLQKQVNK